MQDVANHLKCIHKASDHKRKSKIYFRLDNFFRPGVMFLFSLVGSVGICVLWTHSSILLYDLLYRYVANDLLKRNLRQYHTLQGVNSLKSVECFDHMMFVCRFQASR
jgi:hypothetical protein